VYPCCKYTHGPIDAALAGFAQAGNSLENLERVDIKVTNREVFDLVCEPKLRKWNPETVVDCQFSLPFTVAYALVHGGMSLKALEAGARNDDRVKQLMKRIHVTLDVDKQGAGRGTFPMPGDVTITRPSGQKIRSEVVYVKGHPNNPMTYDEVADKTRVCADFARLPSSRAEELIDLVSDLERLPSAAVLAKVCSASS
jgi:2-methylcitrate dehydratase PrpD